MVNLCKNRVRVGSQKIRVRLVAGTTLRGYDLTSIRIERGRYLRPVIPVKDRLCLICDKSDIENEEHFLLHCTKYNDIRTVCNIDEIITSHNQNICSILNNVSRP